MKKAKIFLQYFLIVGSPGENKKTIGETVEVLRRSRPDIIVVTYLTPYPGTELYEQNKELLTKYNFGNFTYLNTPIPLSGLSEKQLRKFRTKILISFYFSPFFILKNLLNLNSLSKIHYFLLEIRALISYLILKK